MNIDGVNNDSTMSNNLGNKEGLLKFLEYVHINKLYEHFDMDELYATIMDYKNLKNYLCRQCLSIHYQEACYRLTCNHIVCYGCKIKVQRDTRDSYYCRFCQVTTMNFIEIKYPIDTNKLWDLRIEFDKLFYFKEKMDEIMNAFPKVNEANPPLMMAAISAQIEAQHNEEMTRRIERRANRRPSDDWSD